MKTLLDQVQTQDERPYSALNLAQGATRQQRPNMAKLLSALAQSYQIQALNAREQGAPVEEREQELADVQAQLKAQLTGYAPAIEQATELGECGVLRALLWGQKVTMIQNSLLNRLSRQGAALFKGQQGLHVCKACGFVILDGERTSCPHCGEETLL